MKLIYLIPFIALFGCQTKSVTKTTVHIQCDSCYAKVQNTSDNQTEIVFDGPITGTKNIDMFRFIHINCIQIVEFQNYSIDTPVIYAIENNDTIQGNEFGFCF